MCAQHAQRATFSTEDSQCFAHFLHFGFRRKWLVFAILRKSGKIWKTFCTRVFAEIADLFTPLIFLKMSIFDTFCTLCARIFTQHSALYLIENLFFWQNCAFFCAHMQKKFAPTRAAQICFWCTHRVRTVCTQCISPRHCIRSVCDTICRVCTHKLHNLCHNFCQILPKITQFFRRKFEHFFSQFSQLWLCYVKITAETHYFTGCAKCVFFVFCTCCEKKRSRRQHREFACENLHARETCFSMFLKTRKLHIFCRSNLRLNIVFYKNTHFCDFGTLRL